MNNKIVLTTEYKNGQENNYVNLADYASLQQEYKQLIKYIKALDTAMCEKPIQHVSTKVLNCLNDLRNCINKD